MPHAKTAKMNEMMKIERVFFFFCGSWGVLPSPPSFPLAVTPGRRTGGTGGTGGVGGVGGAEGVVGAAGACGVADDAADDTGDVASARGRVTPTAISWQFGHIS